MASLGSHSNVYNTCLCILRLRQYTIWIEGEIGQDGRFPMDLQWFARKNDETFQAENPIELLGLTAVYEYVNPIGETDPYWWVVEGPDIWQELLDNIVKPN